MTSLRYKFLSIGRFIAYKYLKPLKFYKKKLEISLGKTQEKNIILVIAFNSCDIIKVQYESLVKHCTFQYDYIVVDNSTDKIQAKLLQDFCLINKLTYCKVLNNPYQWPSFSHAYALNAAMKFVASTYGIFENLIILDHDIVAFDSVGAEIFSSLVINVDSSTPDRLSPWAGYMCLQGVVEGIKEFDFRPCVRDGRIFDTASNLPHGITMTHRHIYPKRNFQSELDRNLQFSGMEIIDDKWLHVVNFSNWAPANQSIKSIDSVRSKIKSLEAKI